MSQEVKSKSSKSHLSWRKLPLYLQLVALISSLIAMIVISLSYLTIQRQRETNETEIQQSVLSRLDVLEAASIDALFLSDVDVLDGIGDRMEDSEDVNAVIFFDATGRVIAVSGDHPLESFVGTLNISSEGLDLLDRETVSFVQSNESVSAGLSLKAGRRSIGAVLIEVSTQQFNQSLQVAQQQSILVGIAALALGILVAFIISRILAKPLQDLVVATERIASGNMDEKISLEATNREVGELITSLDFMRSELRDLYGGLEQQVQARTEQLAESNASLVQSNQLLSIAQKEAEDSNRLKSEFLATMSHELRTPLNAIIGFCGLMVMGVYGKIDDAVLEKVKTIEESAKHLLALINDILDISKIEAGRMKLVSEPVEIYDFTESLVKRITVLADDKEIAFKHTLDTNMPDKIMTDDERLTQIATNLLSNAVKFTSEGEVRLQIKLDETDNDKWQMIVEDTGIGMPPESLEYIFDEFRQVDGSYTRAFGGTGLGLAITRKLVEAMSGQIDVVSKLEEGSKFTVTLPLITEPSQAELTEIFE